MLHPSPRWGWISWLGYLKVASTLCKYFPQVVWNCMRQSTRGWSIFTVICDFTGAFFATLEVVTRKMVMADYQINLAKFGLGFFSLIYGCIFITQHYCIYPQQSVHTHETIHDLEE